MFHYTFRRLRRSPASTRTSILVLAIGIGATSAIFSIVSMAYDQASAVTLNPERLIALTHR